MKISPTMKREIRNSGFASPVFHPKKWPPWSDCPYHRAGAAPIKTIKLPDNHPSGKAELTALWTGLQSLKAYWRKVEREAKDGVYLKVTY